MDADILAPELWETVKQYIPAKDKQTAADHVVTNLIDLGADDEVLKELQGLDINMKNAVAEHLDEDDPDQDEDWDEDY